MTHAEPGGAPSPVALLEDTLAALEARDGELNCFASVRADAARRDAAAAADELARGRRRGPLHGMPIALKDNIAVAGEPTTAGSPLFDGWRPAADAALVGRLREAGAVIVGKCNLYELAFGAPHPRFGAVRNPWRVDCDTGGSSSGSAAAVAAELCRVALGTDTGGSVRIPAALCGVVGLKPTYGTLDLAGVVPVSPSLDHAGTLTRTVRDAALVFGALLAGDAPERLTTDLDGDAAGLSIGVASLDAGRPIDPEVRAALDGLAERLGEAGATLDAVALPDLGLAQALMLAIAGAEAADFHHEALRTRAHLMEPVARTNIELGDLIPASLYVRAQRVRPVVGSALDAVLAERDAVLLPTLPFAAYPAGATTVAYAGIREGLARAITRYTALANVTGHPAVSVPIGLTTDGRPLAAQLVGHRHAEARLLRVAAACEALAAFAPRRPPLSPLATKG